MRRSLLAAACLGLGCEQELELSIGELRDAGAAVEEGGSPGFNCAQRGPLYDVGDEAQGACGESSAGFHFAFCSCGEIQNSQPIQIDGFDSRTAPYAPGGASGSLAMNGPLFGVATQIGGSLVIAGGEGAPLSGDLSVGGNLFDQGQLQGRYAVSVGGDARVGGDVRVSRLSVGGALTLAPEAALAVEAGAPPASRATVAVRAPCGCSTPLDLRALIDAASRDNDNASLNIEPANWLRAFDAPLERALPCGRYSVDEIYGDQPITLRIQGRVALYVQTRIVMEDGDTLTILLEGDSELDLFVQNDISARGPVQIGSPSAPSRVRLHFGGAGTLNFGSTALIAGSLYAPAAPLVTKDRFELYGAGLVARVSAANPLLLHYDRALARDSCAGATCRGPSDCGTDLRCDNGLCLP